jgi:hypothetical protein
VAGQNVRDHRAMVSALRDVPRVAKALHQHIPERRRCLSLVPCRAVAT